MNIKVLLHKLLGLAITEATGKPLSTYLSEKYGNLLEWNFLLNGVPMKKELRKLFVASMEVREILQKSGSSFLQKEIGVVSKSLVKAIVKNF